MHYLDLVLILIIGTFVLKGLHRGFFSEALGLVGFFLGIIIAINAKEPVSVFLASIFGLSSAIAHMVSIIVLFFVVVTLFSIVAFFLTKTAKKLKLSIMNRILGGAFGAVEAILCCGLVLTAVIKNPLFSNLDAEIASKSILAPIILNFSIYILDALSI